MKKQYDYWLIIWKRDGDEIHEPACFQVGINPKDWADAILDKSNNTRDEKAARYDSYELHRLHLSGEEYNEK